MKVIHGFLFVLHAVLGVGEVAQILTAPPVVANAAANINSDESSVESLPSSALAEPGSR